MLILAIDSSGQTASAALVTEEKVLAEMSTNCGYTHSQTLMPLVDCIVKYSDIKLQDIDYIACAGGPGSFTGLRIGAACAKGLAASLGIKMVNVSTLDALAYNITKTDGFAAPIMDARRGEVYAAVYGFSQGFARITDYIADSIENVIALAKTFGEKAQGGRVTFLGDGVSVHRELLLASGMDIVNFCHSLQRAACVGALAIQEAREGRAVEAKDFRILYIRKPQAEREHNG